MNVLKNIGKIIIFLAVVGATLYFSVFVLIGASWSGLFIGFEFVPMIVYVPAVLGIWLTVLSALAFRESLKKIGLTTLAFVLAFVAIVAFGVGRDFYNKKMTISEEIDTTVYAPFSGNKKLAKLDELASLKLEGDLPRLDGATALYPVYSAFAEAVYPEKEYNTYASEIMCNNTVYAYENLINGDVDIIFVAGPSVEQKERAKNLGVDLHLTPIGNEAFVFFVNKSNKVSSLSLDEIKGIYKGDIINWKEVGGKDRDIIAYQRNENSGSQTMFLNLMQGVDIKQPPVNQEVDGMGGIIERAADYKNADNAIGFSFLYYATQMKANNKIKTLAINGVAPNKETIRNKDYPFTGTFYAITNGKPTGNVKLFIDWILSEQGQELIEKTGYVGL